MTVSANIEIRRKEARGVDDLIDKSKPGGIKVGFVKGLGKHPGSNATISEIAAYNEFGTQGSDGQERIPERPFLRTTLKENLAPVYMPLLKHLMSLMINGELTVEQAVGVLGEKAVTDVKTKIDTLSEPPNAESTIAKKKSSSPLVNTKLMAQSVTWEKVD
jgi:hypothetical protein